MVAVMLCNLGMLLTSCSKDENDSPDPMKNLVGQWIVEKTAEEDILGGIPADMVLPADGNQYVLIYCFNADGTGWQEFDILQDGKLIHQPYDRYDTEFHYTVNTDGTIALQIDSEVSDKVSFDGSVLKHSTGDKTVSYGRATQQQIEKYKVMTDEWHGGTGQNIVDLSKLGKNTYTAKDGDVLTGKLTNNKALIHVAPGATITLRNARIEYRIVGAGYHWAGLECEGNATIILEGSNYVIGADIGCPAIYPYQDATLTIKGSGSLEAIGEYNAPGSGSGTLTSGFQYEGNVVIEGGTIIAKGGMGAPGIGTYDDEIDGITIKATVGSVKAVKGSKEAKESIGVGRGGKVGKVTIEPGAKVVQI